MQSLRQNLLAFSLALAFAFAFVSLLPFDAFAESPTTRPASPERLRSTIRQLTHPLPSRRRAAIRQLAEWGPLAFPELRRVAKGSDLEAALSARDLLNELESAVLIGADVQLEVSRPTLAWQEPLTVSIAARNPTEGPIRVPWAAPTTSQPAGDAGQVARMMDVADFLVVTGPDGKAVDLRVEPIERDPAVYREVDIRAQGTPPSHEVPPGQAARLDLPLFNRGWARYPMLRAGRYTIRLEYQPQWKDKSWTRDGFGRVRSEPVSVEVRPGSPAAIASSSIPLEMRLQRGGDRYRAALVSCWDTPLFVNLNFGSPGGARIEWRVIQKVANAEPVDLPGPEGEPVFRADRLVELQPGETRVISEISTEVVTQQINLSGKKSSAELNIRYVSLLGPVQLREELARLGRPIEIPRQLFSGVVSATETPARADER